MTPKIAELDCFSLNNIVDHANTLQISGKLASKAVKDLLLGVVGLAVVVDDTVVGTGIVVVTVVLASVVTTGVMDGTSSGLQTGGRGVVDEIGVQM